MITSARARGRNCRGLFCLRSYSAAAENIYTLQNTAARFFTFSAVIRGKSINS